MGNDKRGTACHDLFDGVLNKPLGHGINGTGRLVEHENARVGQQRTGKGQKLLFARGEGIAALADVGVIAVRQTGDNLVGGDSLYGIARRYGTDAAELARINQLNDPARLVPGMALLVPGGTADRRAIEVNAYAYPAISDAVMAETMPYLTFFCPFCYQADAAGGLLPIEDARMIAAAYADNAAPLLTVTNLGRSGGFSGEIAHALFTDKTAQDALFENIFSVLRMKNYYGVNFNIEYVYPYDRDSYSQFLRRAADELHPRGYFLSTAIAPKESAGQEGLLYTAHDYAAHGRYADRVIIMTYEWGYTYSAPQAVSPVNRMRRVLEYAVGEIPPGKILMGFSNYGYSWRLPWRQGDAATVISNAAAMNLAASAGAEIKFDRTAQAPFFTYTDAAGVRRVVWFEDARSVRARLELVNEYGLAGISCWTVNRLYRPGLELLQGMFDAEKVI